MCGRYTLTCSSEDIAKIFNVGEVPNFVPRFNIAPTQPVLTVRQPAADAELEVKLLRWGLIPSWAKQPTKGAPLINARAETVAEKPAFRAAFKRRRCLILADGFYEWRSEGKQKQPFYFQLKTGQVFGFAGLWESWQNDSNIIESCTIITTTAKELMASIHERMPVILSPQDYQVWLNPAIENPAILQPLIEPVYPPEIKAYPVTSLVNKTSNDSPECITPATDITAIC